MQITTCSDASGRSVTFSDKKFLATSFAGLLPIAHIARSLGLFENAKEVVCAAVPSKCNTQYSPQVMFEQRVLALAAGFEDLNDHDQLFHDPGFSSALHRSTQRDPVDDICSSQRKTRAVAKNTPQRLSLHFSGRRLNLRRAVRQPGKQVVQRTLSVLLSGSRALLSARLSGCSVRCGGHNRCQKST